MTIAWRPLGEDSLPPPGVRVLLWDRRLPIVAWRGECGGYSWQWLTDDPNIGRLDWDWGRYHWWIEVELLDAPPGERP